MDNIDFKNVNLYDWVPFFIELSNTIAEIGKESNRDELLKQASGECFGFDSPIYTYRLTDPFSFIYFLAQKNTINQKEKIYNRVREVFKLENQVPTDWIFPTPTPNTAALFHDAVHFETELLWSIFIQATQSETIDNSLFLKAFTIKTVKSSKLTQTLFLINPERFIAIDDRVISLPVFPTRKVKYFADQVESAGFSFYQGIINQLKNSFPGCALYEINLFAYLLHSRNLSVNDLIYQISSNIYNEGDIINEVYKSNSVWTGGPRSGDEGSFVYPVTDPKKGDIIVVRTGNYLVRSIALVLENDYSESGKWTEKGRIKILRLSAIDRYISENQFTRKEAINRITKAKEKTLRNVFPEPFKIIDSLTGKSKIMEQITKDSVKNLILQGAPGTGKTRLAKQLALYLQTEDSSLISFLTNYNNILEERIFNEDPIIEKDHEQIKIVQFHPGYTYEDFVRGIVTEIMCEGKVNYAVKDKVLMQVVKDASENTDKKYVLIIDEMNRANIPSVLGELIYALEYRGESVNGIYEDNIIGTTDISIPNNLYIIGTMNTADRSIGHIDYAIRRRFVFKNVLSESKFISDSLAKAVFNQIETFFTPEHLSPEFKKEDVILGHSYFLTGKRSFKLRLEFEIIPLLKEYVKDGILIGDKISDKIEDLKKYV